MKKILKNLNMNIPRLFIVIIIIICLIIYYNSFSYIDISTHIANVNASVIIDWGHVVF